MAAWDILEFMQQVTGGIGNKTLIHKPKKIAIRIRILMFLNKIWSDQEESLGVVEVKINLFFVCLLFHV